MIPVSSCIFYVSAIALYSARVLSGGGKPGYVSPPKEMFPPKYFMNYIHNTVLDRCVCVVGVYICRGCQMV